MRVLFVHAGNMYGGTERVLETLATKRQLCPALDSHFALCFEGRLADEIRSSGAPLSILGGVRVTRPHLVVRTRRRLTDLVARVSPDALVTQSAWSHAIFAPVARRAQIPLVMWLHDVPHGRTWLDKLAARWPPDLFVCNSRFTERAARFRFPSIPSEVVYCPLAMASSQASRQSVRHHLGVADGAVVVINVGRMEPYKGQRVLIEALARLQTRVAWTCWIVGGAQRPLEEQYEQSLRAAVGAHGLETRVRFLGQRRDVMDLLSAADIFCHSNQGAEPFGLAIVEALHAGLPAVATELGGPEEILTDGCGRLVPAGDPRALASALDALISDETTRRRLASEGPARARALCDAGSRIEDLRRALQGVLAKAAA